MKPYIIQVSENFWNIRGSFKIGGFIDIGTHASLIRRDNGKFIFLDSLTLGEETLEQVNKLTNNGNEVEAVLNLHPFHTIHVAKMFEQFPNAKHYGTARHISKAPQLNWEELRMEDKQLHELFAADLEFSIPSGVDFISDNENLHFSSVLAYHKTSRTIHVDDTLMFIKMPKIMSKLGMSNRLSFHPTLSKVLEKRKGATADFQTWASELASSWSEAENLCAAHTATFLGKNNTGASINNRILQALKKIGPKLETHRVQYG